jgi:heterodisulfide reductase subunit B
MRFAYFPGCKIPYFLPQYDQSTRAVLTALGVELVDLEFDCCGYPVRHQSVEAAFYSAAKVMALAQAQPLPLLTPCMCCFGNLKHAEYWLLKESALRNQINDLLAADGLHWKPGMVMRHLLTVLDRDVGLATIRSEIKKPFKGLRVAAHYGCHGLRPSDVVQLDNAAAPTIFERLITATGAQSVDWPLRLSCCGNPLWQKNSKLSLALMQQKLHDALASGAQLLCTACTYCQIQFDSVRAAHLGRKPHEKDLPAVLYTQLLGRSLGLDRAILGIDSNKFNWVDQKA